MGWWKSCAGLKRARGMEGKQERRGDRWMVEEQGKRMTGEENERKSEKAGEGNTEREGEIRTDAVVSKPQQQL